MIFASRGTAKIPSKNLVIKGDKFVYDKVASVLTIYDDVKYDDNENQIFIEGQKLIYNDLDNLVFSQGETIINLENKYEIFSSNVFYDRNILEIYSKENTEVNDNIENKFIFEEGLLLASQRKLYLQI